MRDRLVFLGAILFAAIAAAAGIVFYRWFKRRHPNRHQRSHHHRPFRRTAVGVTELKQMLPELRRRRRSRRSRKPTLAETGGLPPLRSDKPLETPQPRTPAQ